MEIADFIRARLDEDEAAVSWATPGPWTNSGGPYVGADGHGIIMQARSSEDATHVARHDPARVLREVAADRRLLAELEKGTAAAVAAPDNPAARAAAEALLWAASIRAAIWSDHPDYRNQWKP